jgi:hypothetical protein
MATIYKTITYSEKENRNTRALTSDELTQVNAILNNFKNHFISKHL